MESTSVPRVRPFRRSAGQTATLLLATGGLYIFFWSFFMRRACADLLEREDQPLWKSIALIVPIFNLFLLFDIGKRIEGVAWRAEPEKPQPELAWLGAVTFIIQLLWRLPGMYFFLCLFAFVPPARMHVVFERAQAALVGEPARPTRLTWIEWVVIVIGFAFWLLALAGGTFVASTDDPPGGVIVAWLVTVGAPVLAVVFGRAGRRALAEGLALHAVS